MKTVSVFLLIVFGYLQLRVGSLSQWCEGLSLISGIIGTGTSQATFLGFQGVGTEECVAESSHQTLSCFHSVPQTLS